MRKAEIVYNMAMAQTETPLEPAPVRNNSVNNIEERVQTPEKDKTPRGFEGLTPRLLIGGDALRLTTILAPVEAANLRRFQARNYSPFEQASNRERSEWWKKQEEKTPEERQERWLQGTISTFTNERAKVFFETERGKEWALFFKNIDIHIENFQNPETAAQETEKIFNRYFKGSKKDSQVKLFIHHAVNAHVTDGIIDIHKLQRNMAAIRWFGNIFGKNSGIITALLADAEARVEMGGETLNELLDEANKKETINGQEVLRINNLNQKERDLLEFLGVAQAMSDGTTEARRTGEGDIPPHPAPEKNGFKAEEGGKHAETPNTETGQEALPERPYTTYEIFDFIKGPIDKNHPRFIENPPGQIPLNSLDASSLELRLPFFINIKTDPSSPEMLLGCETNPLVIPFVFDETGRTKRFKNGEAATHGDSGLVGLAAASAPDAQRQAKLYKSLTQAILSVHSSNKTLLNEWRQEQEFWAQENGGSYAYFVGLDHTEDGQLRPENERLFPYNGPLSPNIEQFMPFWAERKRELATALQQDRLYPHHLRWIEFLAHSVNVDRLMQIAKQNQEGSHPFAQSGTPPEASSNPPKNPSQSKGFWANFKKGFRKGRGR